MAKLVRFPAQTYRQTADQLLRLSVTSERLKRPEAWSPNRPRPQEPLGNMLQRLATLQPTAVLVLENIVADMLAKVEGRRP